MKMYDDVHAMSEVQSIARICDDVTSTNLARLQQCLHESPASCSCWQMEHSSDLLKSYESCVVLGHCWKDWVHQSTLYSIKRQLMPHPYLTQQMQTSQVAFLQIRFSLEEAYEMIPEGLEKRQAANQWQESFCLDNFGMEFVFTFSKHSLMFNCQSFSLSIQHFIASDF